MENSKDRQESRHRGSVRLVLPRKLLAEELLPRVIRTSQLTLGIFFEEQLDKRQAGRPEERTKPSKA